MVRALWRVLVVLSLAGCGSDGPAATRERPAIPVETAVVATEDVPLTIDAVGTLEAAQAIDLKPKRAGHIRELAHAEGRPVRRGDVVVRLDDADLQAQLRLARAAVTDARVREENARRIFERTRPLHADGIASQQQYDDVKAELDRAVASLNVARAQLASAEAQLAETVIVAPFSGILGRRPVDVGDFVREGESLGTLVDVDPLDLVFAIPERHLARLHRGQPVEVTVASHGARVFRGDLSFVDPQVDPLNRTVTVKATLRNADGELRPGQFASVTLELDRYPQATVIPEESVVPDGDRTLVFVVADGVAAARPIQTGIRLPGRVQVVEGLAPGEVVVRAGHEKLQRETETEVTVDATGAGRG